MGEYKLTLLYKRGLDYKTRNFIFLIIVLILSVIISVWVQRELRNKNIDLQKENTKLSTEYDELKAQVQLKDTRYAHLERVREEQFLSDKIIPNTNNTTISISYIHSLFRRYRCYFYFNFKVISSGTVEKDKDVAFNRYSLIGKAYINEFYTFLDQFERQPAFFTIESIVLESLLPEEQGKISFNIEVNAYHTKTGTPFEQIGLRNLKRRRIPYNIFYPRIYEPFITGRDISLPDVYDYEVIGMTAHQVYVRNIRTGNMETLEVGSPVQFGRLDSIDWQRQEAIFRLNRTGLAETIRLSTIR